MKKSILFLFIFSLSGILLAQPDDKSNSANRKKIGLVLSGGGAKGFAHIGAIQLLEEAGIKPDYITGTSMGSIVGALYAMGYSVAEMKQISDTTQWEMVLSNTVSLADITVAEKPYYGTFLTELDVKKSGVSLPGGLIEGQNLLEKLSVLTRPVHGITDFTKFPIPYTCVATDIVKGEAVALNKGSITEAIRASMAIPTAFTPVQYDSLLLIDGGWTRNLPVKEARDMGADIIISVDVGSGLKPKEDLESMVSILDQTMWMLSVHDTEEQLKNSDYVISPPVRGFSTFDFDLADTIIAAGYQEAAKQRQVFEELAKKIYPNGRYEGIIKKPFFEKGYLVSNVVVSGNESTSENFVKGRLELKKNNRYTAEEISQKIGRLYGSLYYKKIDFQLIPLADSTQELRINVVEDNPIKLKLSLYYDSENSVGFNVNATFRNLLFENSRLIFDGFVSENPIFGLKYVKYVGQNQNAFIFSDTRFTKDANYTWFNFNVPPQPAGYSYRDMFTNLGFIYSLKNQLMVGASAGWQGANMNPTVNPDTIVERWTQTSFPITGILEMNTLDKAVFPTRGIKLWTNVLFHFDINQTAHLKPEFTLFTQEQANEATAVDPYVLFKVGVQKYIPVTKKITLYADAILTMPSHSNIGFNDYSKIGGIAPILNSSSPFWGASRNEVNVNQFAMVSAGFQFELLKSFYFKGKVNYLNTQYPMVWLSPDLKKEDFEIDGRSYTEMLGFGGELAYNSPFGPVRFVLHQNQYSKSLHMFIAVGFNIYKSNGHF